MSICMKKNKQPQIIFFNDEDMKCYTLNNLEITNNLPDMVGSDNFYEPKQLIEAYVRTYCNGEIGDKVELDNATMKKIAKFNAEKDIDLLIRKKQVLEDEIKLLQEKKSTEEQKFKQLSKFANEFLKSNENNIEDYIQENYIDDDDYLY